MPSNITHASVQQLGAAVDFIKVKAVSSTGLTSTAALRDSVMQVICQRGTNPMIVSDGYTISADSYLIVALKTGCWTAADLQVAIRALGTPLDTAVVTITSQLVGN